MAIDSDLKKEIHHMVQCRELNTENEEKFSHGAYDSLRETWIELISEDDFSETVDQAWIEIAKSDDTRLDSVSTDDDWWD